MTLHERSSQGRAVGEGLNAVDSADLAKSCLHNERVVLPVRAAGRAVVYCTVRKGDDGWFAVVASNITKEEAGGDDLGAVLTEGSRGGNTCVAHAAAATVAGGFDELGQAGRVNALWRAGPVGWKPREVDSNRKIGSVESGRPRAVGCGSRGKSVAGGRR